MTNHDNDLRIYRVAHVDDHETVQLGFAALLSQCADIAIVASVASVRELNELTGASELSDASNLANQLDLVVLDVRLSDGSTIAENVLALREQGINVLVFTSADNAAEVRAASRTGVLGIVRKSEPRDVIIDAVREAARGNPVATTDWAAALDSDPELAAAGLSPKEQEVLAHYASGDKSIAVAHRVGLSSSTVAEYVRRIRYKYAMVGRPAHTKVDLYKRAVEDGILPPP
ncbi:LuxR family two component transcriptional regulator [Rhodoglobus vestalii]|uniref:LuxR family two component transcriptional regulator n=1 Tax=Rhodoglobus vestalii TaxID=193384 RepID=A0A8H2K816_9MICO|nr:response regulator transcription factor [Rhodoglobus vestalii]TQO20389.1 LuxR family two component transcriptional regulator [Rhodoglobus vestalii]